MQVDVAVSGQAAPASTAGLRDWLQAARIRGVERLDQQRRPPAPGEQGPELLALLTVVLAGPAVVELVRSIHKWIEATRPTVTITVKSGDRTVTIDARNPGSVGELVAEAERLAKE
jgi:hypothetical protein